MPAVSLSAAVQATTPAAVLSWCWCSLTLTLTTSMGIWQGAGATRGVTSPTAHRGKWHGAGVTKSWFLVLQLFCSCRISLMCRQLPPNSLWSFVRMLTLVVVQSLWLEIEELLSNLVISLENWRVEPNNHSFLITWPDWARCSQHFLDSRLFCLFIGAPLSLFLSSTVPLRPFGRP